MAYTDRIRLVLSPRERHDDADHEKREASDHRVEERPREIAREEGRDLRPPSAGRRGLVERGPLELSPVSFDLGLVLFLLSLLLSLLLLLLLLLVLVDEEAHALGVGAQRRIAA